MNATTDRVRFRNLIASLSLDHLLGEGSTMRLASLVAGILLTIVNLVPGPAQAQNKVVAIINGSAITEADMRLAEIEWGNQVGNLPPEARRGALLQLLLQTQLAAGAALDEKLLSPTQQGDLERFSVRLALQSYSFQKRIREQITETEVRALYDAQVQVLPEEEEVKASHILTDSFEQATELASKLSSGANFAGLARQFSLDPTTNLLGGNLGYFVRTQMIPEVEQEAFALQKGQISRPFKSQFGWHILRVDDRRRRAVPKFEEIKAQLTGLLLERKTQDVLASLREKAKIEIREPGLVPTAPTANQAAAPPTAAPPTAAPTAPQPAPATLAAATDGVTSKSAQRSEAGFSIYDDRDIAGEDLSVLKKVELSVCSKACRDNQACLAFSYDRWNKWCFLTSSARTLTLDPSSISGAREGLPPPAASGAAIRIERRPSKRLVGALKNSTAETIGVCEGACQGQSSCVGYSYSAKEHVCGLFESINSFAPNGGVVSGIKTQSPP